MAIPRQAVLVSQSYQKVGVCLYTTFHTLIDTLPCLICREPRGFGFVQFVEPSDAMEAQHHMNGQVFAGRQMFVVVAAETRKRPEEMRHRARVR